MREEGSGVGGARTIKNDDLSPEKGCEDEEKHVFPALLVRTRNTSKDGNRQTRSHRKSIAEVLVQSQILQVERCLDR